MRLSQTLLIVVVTFVACYSTATTAENLPQIQNTPTDNNREFTKDARRSLKGNTKTTGLDAVGEERVGSSVMNFKQFFSSAKFPKIPGTKWIKAFLKKLGEWDTARRQRKFQNNPNAYGI
ncbi:RxLR effector protein [Phytophthora megakarya]|uniref:RxLR effector protein n=1 Tax=Phytophthora megakarya TaxID=4795 RepID=A0A225VIK3_9STRA|nr:RxLR effector protein [Phytophthora megakarya]